MVALNPQEVLRMVNAAPRPTIVLLDLADVARDEEQLNDVLHQDAEYNITYGHSRVDRCVDGCIRQNEEWMDGSMDR